MKTRRPIDPEAVRQAIAYDPDTGDFSWRVKPRGAKPGERPGGKGPSGYTMIGIGGVSYVAHRIVWAYMTGNAPPHNIDHINGDKSDNRWRNLRAATVSQNRANAKKPSNNTSGFKGVSWHKASNLWTARATVNGKDVTIGYFASREEAAACRRKFVDNLHGAFARHE